MAKAPGIWDIDQIIRSCHPIPLIDYGEILSVGLQELDYFPAYGIDFCGAEDIDIKASIPVWSRLVSEMAYLSHQKN